jgi:hypothetical protein
MPNRAGAVMSAAGHGTVLVGVFYSCRQAELALSALQHSGFRDDQLRVTLYDLKPPFPAEPERYGAYAVLTPALLGETLGGLAAWLTGLWALGLAAALAGILLGSLLVRVSGSGAPARPAAGVQLKQGVVSVRPDGRAAEAASILCRYAGAPCDPALLLGAEGR